MNIMKSATLTEEEIAQIRAAEALSLAAEGLENEAFLSNEINFDTTLPCFYRYYENGTLQAFLTTFMPSSDVAEIVAFTHPDARRKGYFTALLRAAKQDLLAANIHKILFAMETKSKTATATLESITSPVLERSEYRMEHTGNGAINALALAIQPVTHENIDIFAQLENEAFPSEEENENFMQTVLESPTRHGYLLYDGADAVGAFNINIETDAFLYGVVVREIYRGRGYGKALVQHALRLGLAQKEKLVLDVDSDNPAAFHLYQKCGFTIAFQVDYYSFAF